jgi:hypothetical protein
MGVIKHSPIDYGMEGKMGACGSWANMGSLLYLYDRLRVVIIHYNNTISYLFSFLS